MLVVLLRHDLFNFLFLHLLIHNLTNFIHIKFIVEIILLVVDLISLEQ
jgi:hypothetical protein